MDHCEAPFATLGGQLGPGQCDVNQKDPPPGDAEQPGRAVVSVSHSSHGGSPCSECLLQGRWSELSRSVHHGHVGLLGESPPVKSSDGLVEACQAVVPCTVTRRWQRCAGPSCLGYHSLSAPREREVCGGAAIDSVPSHTAMRWWRRHLRRRLRRCAQTGARLPPASRGVPPGKQVPFMTGEPVCDEVYVCADDVGVVGRLALAVACLALPCLHAVNDERARLKLRNSCGFVGRTALGGRCVRPLCPRGGAGERRRAGFALARLL